MKVILKLGRWAVFWGLNILCASFSYGMENDGCSRDVEGELLEEAIQLSDTARFQDYSQAAERIARLGEILAIAGDRRGIFTSMYTVITEEAVASIDRQEYVNKIWAEELVLEFMRAYLKELHKELRQLKTNSFWGEYYSMAKNCQMSDLSVLSAGMNTHLTYDLPYTLAAIKTSQKAAQDFLRFGNILIEKKEAGIDLLKEHHGVEAKEFFNGFFIGQSVDSLLGDGTSSLLGFQLIRTEAWVAGSNLQSDLLRPMTKFLIEKSWALRQEISKRLPWSRS